MDLQTLSKTLRDKSLWPEGFKWDYGACQTCAVGLTLRLAGTYYGESHASEAARLLGFGGHSEPECFKIFFEVKPSAPLRKVKPEDVADEIDRILARRAS